MSDKTQITEAVNQAAAHYGKLDIVWANAGIVSRGGAAALGLEQEVLFEDMTEDDWNDVLGVNLTGVIYTAQAAVPHLKANGGGTILATSSAASLAAYPNIPMYCATKANIGSTGDAVAHAAASNPNGTTNTSRKKINLTAFRTPSLLP